MSAKTGLLGLLALVAAGFLVFWITAERRFTQPGAGRRARPSVLQLGIGALTDFLDTLGVGSFAPRRLCSDSPEPSVTSRSPAP